MRKLVAWVAVGMTAPLFLLVMQCGDGENCAPREGAQCLEGDVY